MWQETDDYIVHYGVLGMKWGIRHDKDKGSGRNAPINIKRLTDRSAANGIVGGTNPNYGRVGYNMNCSFCCIASALRYKGYDVTAKASDYGDSSLVNIHKAFNGVHVYTRSAGKVCQTVDETKEAIKRSCCKDTDNAYGYISVQWNDGGGHAFNWIYKDGGVMFVDGQCNAGAMHLTAIGIILTGISCVNLPVWITVRSIGVR